jgi:hypothetical protein
MDESKIMNKVLTSHGVRVAFANPGPRGVRPDDWACAGADPDLFFPADDQALEVAQAICSDCPLQATCRSLAIARLETGVWGGVLFDRGKALASVPIIGRPRKKAA